MNHLSAFGHDNETLDVQVDERGFIAEISKETVALSERAFREVE